MKSKTHQRTETTSLKGRIDLMVNMRAWDGSRDLKSNGRNGSREREERERETRKEKQNETKREIYVSKMYGTSMCMHCMRREDIYSVDSFRLR